MTRLILIAPLLALAACAQTQEGAPPTTGPAATPAVALPETQAEVEAVVTSAGRAQALPPAPRSAEDFDTTTEAERAVAVAAARAPAETAERALGTTVASLGNPADPGLWLETPLAEATGPGRLAYGGESVLVELRPIPGPEGAGSRISLPALRLLKAPLTGLPEIEVFAR